MNEAETIDAYILPALKAAGWGAAGCRIRCQDRITEGRIYDPARQRGQKGSEAHQFGMSD